MKLIKNPFVGGLALCVCLVQSSWAVDSEALADELRKLKKSPTAGQTQAPRALQASKQPIIPPKLKAQKAGYNPVVNPAPIVKKL
jgi:hypothetical protein